jgi:hypothetical protein
MDWHKTNTFKDFLMSSNIILALFCSSFINSFLLKKWEAILMKMKGSRRNMIT